MTKSYLFIRFYQKIAKFIYPTNMKIEKSIEVFISEPNIK